MEKFSGYIIPFRGKKAAAIAMFLLFSSVRGMYPVDSSASARAEIHLFQQEKQAILHVEKNATICNTDKIHIADHKNPAGIHENGDIIYVKENTTVSNWGDIYFAPKAQYAKRKAAATKKTQPLQRKNKPKTNKQQKNIASVLFRGKNTNEEFSLKAACDKILLLPESASHKKKTGSNTAAFVLWYRKYDDAVLLGLPKNSVSQFCIICYSSAEYTSSLFIRPPPSRA